MLMLLLLLPLSLLKFLINKFKLVFLNQNKNNFNQTLFDNGIRFLIAPIHSSDVVDIINGPNRKLTFYMERKKIFFFN